MSKPYFYNYQYSLTDNLNVPTNTPHSSVITEDVTHRINTYELIPLLSPEYDILDIGCAEGMFCIKLAPYVKSATGIDPIPSHLKTAELYAQSYNIQNCNWITQDFVTFCQNNNKQFDIVMCFATHSYIIGTHKECHWDEGEMPMTDFIGFSNYLIDLIKPEGYLIIEGHPTFDTDHQDWEPLMSLLVPKLNLLKLKMGRPSRPLAIFKKNIE